MKNCVLTEIPVYNRLSYLYFMLIRSSYMITIAIFLDKKMKHVKAQT